MWLQGQMIIKNRAWLTALATVLLALSMAVATESIFSTGKAFYISGFATLVVMATISFLGNVLFYGAIDVRNMRWPRVAFFMSLIITMTAIGIAVWRREESGVEFLKHFLPTGAVSALLLWYGSTALFSSFFLGKGVAAFMHDPVAALFGKRE